MTAIVYSIEFACGVSVCAEHEDAGQNGPATVISSCPATPAAHTAETETVATVALTDFELHIASVRTQR